MREAGSALVLLVAALAGLVEAGRLPLGRVATPGPGFFPFGMALGLAVTAAILVLGALGSPPAAKPVAAAAGGRARLVTVVVALFLYTALLGWLGFVAATFLLMIVLFRVVQSHRWPVAVIAGAAAVLSHALFKTWLAVRLPPGPWGF